MLLFDPSKAALATLKAQLALLAFLKILRRSFESLRAPPPLLRQNLLRSFHSPPHPTRLIV